MQLITAAVSYQSPGLGADLSIVRGESMDPTLKSGDIILVARKVTEPREGIFVVRLERFLLVKRLQVYPGQRIEVCSDNLAYTPFALDVRDPPEDFPVIGRVLCSIHSHI